MLAEVEKRLYRYYYSERYESTGKKLCADGNVTGTVVQGECKVDRSQRGR